MYSTVSAVKILYIFPSQEWNVKVTRINIIIIKTGDASNYSELLEYLWCCTGHHILNVPSYGHGYELATTNTSPDVAKYSNG